MRDRAIIVLVLSGLLGSAASASPEMLHYVYFKEARPLRLDHARVAMMPLTPGVNVSAAAVQAGLDPATVSSYVANWRLIRTPAHRRSLDEVRQIVRRLQVPERTFASPVFVDDLGGPLIVTPEILVRFRPEVPPDRAEGILAEHGLSRILNRDWAQMRGTYRVRLTARDGFDVLNRANALALRPEVIFAEPDFLFTGRSAGAPVPPPDPLFPTQWHLNNVGQLPCAGPAALAGFDLDVLEAWAITTGSPSIITVVLDTGTQLDHPDLLLDPLLSNDVTGQNSGGWPTNECENHGTAVSGVISSLINGFGVVGVAPSTKVASVRCFVGNVVSPCTGSWTSFASWTVAALDWAETIGARITNNSNSYGFTSAAIASKYEQTRNDGMVHFASSGNNGTAQISYPANLCSVNAVGWLTTQGVLHPNSNNGPGIAFTAPGSRILTTDRTGSDGYNPTDFSCFNGTSAAAPAAAGVAALVLSVHPNLSAVEVEVLLQRTTMDLGGPGYDLLFGWGMVNALNALSLPNFNIVDINGDGVVNVDDLLAVINSWGPCPGICPAPCEGDVTGDRFVNVDDLLAVINNWG